MQYKVQLQKDSAVSESHCYLPWILFSVLLSVSWLGPDSYGVITSARYHELSSLVEHETLHSILVSNQGSDLQFKISITNEI